ncbi:tRNA (adenosine(37)-N6)-threonylcarbamoyltransferase complex dimerization subunit type 1 TsaB [Rhizobium sp. TRM95111]|uniref:tRNA (adenosine(37)-N6)-threonylcarbamoyltransferase complex dimerization subunit type 1 TsaB n=1 Tax=Rhizobium alarense TaxID=2846851 RepID=UPI001F1CEA0C|nr:tRNA (adenosine(37)-N6)-threonylcarbamoyltransferase complex dimerization subunit type 1 TsaB [Rhizobium alarense]MCF3639193.1 tRNA (adenosine(37)-N6)-threonylcarbamoyltransferase complex dimerization subunit type 1 TsaB [Rhizobium alarense]
MIVLAIDTAASGCFACVFDSGKQLVLSTAGEEIGRGHAERLMDVIDAALLAARIELCDVDRIAVTIGPGSFTGVRVGVAAARGLGLALAVPVVGISTLAALALAHADQGATASFLVAIDARRDEVYIQAFATDGAALDDAAILALGDARASAARFAAVTGSGAALLVEQPAPRSDSPVDIVAVARLGALADPRSAAPKPLYLRGPDAKPQAGFAIARV